MAAFALLRPFTITNVKPARLRPLLPFPTPPLFLSLLTSFSLIFVLCVLSPSSTLFPLSRHSSTPHSLPSQGGGQKSKMFTFNFTFHVPNPFSMSTLTSVANAATDAFNSVATDIREDPELLNYMVAGLGPGGVAGGFGYDSNKLVNPPPSSSTTHSSPTGPKPKGLKSPQNRHGLTNNPHALHRKRYSQGRERNQGGFHLRGSTSGFVKVNSPPGSGTPMFPTQVYSQSSSDAYAGFGQGVRNQLYPLPASRKRGWVPALSEPSYASTNEDFTTGSFHTPKYYDGNEMGGVASHPAVGHDERGMGGMGLGLGSGDRRKWDDGEDEGESSENAMEAGEYNLGSLFLSPLGFYFRCFISDARFARRWLCDPSWDFVYVRRALTWDHRPRTEKDHITPFGTLMDSEPSSPLPPHV